MYANSSRMELQNFFEVINTAGICEKDCIDQLDGILAYKTTDHKIIHCNNKFLQYIGCKKVSGLEGKTDYDLIWQQYTDIYHGQENDALNGKAYCALHPGVDIGGRDFLFFNRKYPWVDENNNMRGIISYSIEIKDVNLIQVGKLLKETGASNSTGIHFIGKSHSIPDLTNREKQCLFYLVRGKTAKKIGEILYLSRRTVEYHISSLKNKFGCRTKDELIDFALEANFIQIVPSNFFSAGLLDSLSE